MLYIDHHMHIIFILAFCCDSRNLKQLKDPRRELGISEIFIFEFPQIWKEDQFGFNIFLSNYSSIKNKWEKIIWLLQTKRNIGERILKSNHYFIGMLFELEKYCILEKCILVQNNVHLVLNIRFGRWKLFLDFLEFFYILLGFLFAEKFILF